MGTTDYARRPAADDAGGRDGRDLRLFETAACLASDAGDTERGAGTAKTAAVGPLAPLPADPPAEIEDGLAVELHPRTRLLCAGAAALSAAELLAVALGGDEWSSLDLATRVISGAGGLAGLRAASYEDLAGPEEGAGLDEERACKLLAAVELGKRLSSARPGEEPYKISRPQDLYDLLRADLGDLDREHFVAVLVDVKNQVISRPTITVGTLNASPVHPREVLGPAIKAGAASVFVAHNHPSGDASPSSGDREVTRRLADVGQTVGIEVLDHLIVGRDGYVSLKERGML